MVRIAVSGHRGLPAATQRLVDQAIRAELASQQEVTGLSCLADGADQIFARAVLDHGGQIEAVIPATQYRDGLPADAHPEYDAQPRFSKSEIAVQLTLQIRGFFSASPPGMDVTAS
jgi:hypothetical protein